ncbi:MAG: uncharacterized protein QOI32_2312 [Thermoleophilaceae bacterium]|jgi:uncharacterized membrane protein YfcA|nr:uncharacterized protein [Thermoleophilaceae bacterium]
MDALDVTALLALGFAAGMAGGLLGVGGGILFVPALVLFGHLSQLEAVATSLVAIVLVGLVGTLRQREYGNVRLRDGVMIGVLAPLGVLAGVALANALPERALELSFAGVQVLFAVRLALKTGLR